ncbi:MAG: heme ABC exporter ATP-binding protein CcmA [Alphaproteobacteria bacterium]|nr:heme ABC exporter ATP-binding protein CcmA [Alphaproteobacteria bacterium]
MASALELIDLACARGERVLFRGLNLRLEAGEGLLLRGPNGAGKSSLLRILAGLLPPLAGRVAWPRIGDRGRGLVYLGHLDGIKAALSVRENLAQWSAVRGQAAGDAQEALAAFGIAGLADLPARFLSAGQRKRAALARLALAPAPLWLLDEPASALDADGVALLLDAAAKARGQGGIVVAASHGDFALDNARVLRLGESQLS